MTHDLQAQPVKFRQLTAEIVAAYVSNNHVRAAELPDLLMSVHAAMKAVAQGGASATAHAPVEKASAAEIRRSVGRDALISFEDGKPYKTLKRHLSGRALTPETYRAKWGLPADYPMVAPDYAERRSALAKAIGLGRPGRGGIGPSLAADEEGELPEGAASEEPKRRGGKRVA